jgi:succinyl-CoA synthetase beta subunit
MNLHEYQAKELLKKFDLPVPKGIVFIENLSQIEENLETLKGPPWVVKSQIHAGGRGAGKFKNNFNNMGGVQVVSEKNKVFKIAESMINNVLITKQTGDKGKEVKRIYIEEGCKIKKEFYLSILIDRNTSQLMMMISASGGMDIEEVAESNPDEIHYIYFSDLTNIVLRKNLIKTLDISEKQFEELNIIVKKLIKLFINVDASSIEINPLVLNDEGHFILLDSKISLDDNALFRHPELNELQDISEEDPLELEATKNNMNYVKLDGSIGCMVNGAGLAMATMDLIKQFGEEPANFLDLGGTANKERAVKGFKIIQSDSNVKSVLINIFGGIIHCDMIANGIIEAVKELNFKLPIVVRFQGTNSKEGRDIINKSNLGMTSIDDFTEAAKKVVELAK